MEALPNESAILALKRALDAERLLPGDPASERLATWSVFREADKALNYARYVLLNDGETLVGGCLHDSVGTLYWVGVQVPDLKTLGSHGRPNTEPFRRAGT